MRHVMAVLLAVSLALAMATPAHAQEPVPVDPPSTVTTPTPTPPPSDSGQPAAPDPGPLGNAIGAALWGELRVQLEQSGPGIAARLGLWLVGQAVKLVETTTTGGGVGTSGLLFSLPPVATYEAPLVRQAWGVVAGAALAVWGVVASGVVLWLIARLALGYVVADELGLLPLLVGALWAINVSSDAARLVIDAANALAGGLRLGVDSLPAYASISGYERDVARAIAALPYLVLVWFLFGVRAMTLGLVDLLYVLSPLALVLGVLPFTRQWFSWWGGLLVGACAVQVPQVLALTLGTGIVALASRFASATPVVELVIGFCMILLALKLPGMLPGGFGGRGGFVGLGLARRVAKWALTATPTPAGAVRLGAAVRPALAAGAIVPAGHPSHTSPAPAGPVTLRGPLLPAPVPLLPAPRG